MVKGKNDVRIIEVNQLFFRFIQLLNTNFNLIQVPFSINSLNKTDSFILEDGLDIYQWSPPNTNRTERMKANFYAKKIRDAEHGGKSKIIVLGELKS